VAATSIGIDSVVAASGTLELDDGLSVRRLGYGAMRLTGKGIWGPPADEENAVAVLRRAVELGVNLVDTADSYGPEVSEQLIRRALHPYDGVMVATKAGFLRPAPGQWVTCGKQEYLRQQCELSLRRLGVERIDLFQLHRVDSKVPAEDQFGTLRELQQEGKVRLVGLSEVSVEQVEHARTIIEISTVQNRYNVLDRGSDDVLRYCTEQRIGFMPWYPVASGKLAEPGGPVAVAAERLDATPAQVSLAWLLQRSSMMLPIPGTSSLEHLEENCQAATLRLDRDLVDALDDAA